jgi:hypothetical protein
VPFNEGLAEDNNDNADHASLSHSHPLQFDLARRAAPTKTGVAARGVSTQRRALCSRRICISSGQWGPSIKVEARATIDALKAADARVEVANTLDDALGHLKRWRILPGRVQ